MSPDPENNAMVVLEVNSLDEDDFADYSDNQVAQDLLTALTSGT